MWPIIAVTFALGMGVGIAVTRAMFRPTDRTAWRALAARYDTEAARLMHWYQYAEAHHAQTAGGNDHLRARAAECRAIASALRFHAGDQATADVPREDVPRG